MSEEHRINIMDDNLNITQPSEQEQGPAFAGIFERLVALVIDVGVVLFSYQLFLLILLRFVNLDLTWLYILIALVWVPFVLYTAVFSSGGRSTLGKKLVGIRVADKNTGEPLGLFRALVRSLGYLLSAALFMCGFLLAFIDDKRRALQDYLAGSVVVQARHKNWVEKTALGLSGFILLTAFCGYFYKQFFGAGSFAQQRLINRAQKQVEDIGYLEELHLIKFGYYTNDLLRLSLLSGDPVQIQRDMQASLDRKDFRIGISKAGYKIKARAKDNKKTAVYFPDL